MRVLAIDTSTLLGGVAIVDDLSGMVFEVRLNVKSTYSERLMTTIDYALKQSGYTISDMDFFAVATGPGSFTGLRIGLSTVKGFSYATGKPIVSVLTLEALAQNFPFCRYPVCTMLDARKKEVYVALFEWKNEGLVRLISEMSIKVNKALERIIEHDKVVFTGDGVILYKNEIVSLMGERAVFASPEKMVPSPANVACIGMQKALRGEFSDPVNLVPFYIRRSEAEIKENDKYK
jgi:tRNA threonylcarbamoyladenosine biosynthesis protein TsaB